jgi:hypothetical protein
VPAIWKPKMKRTPEIIVKEYTEKGKDLKYIRALAIGCNRDDLAIHVDELLNGTETTKPKKKAMPPNPFPDEIKEIEVK